MAESGAHDVTAFGPFTKDLSDASTIAENTTTVNTAIAEVGEEGGGIICLPPGIYHLAPPDLETSQPASIVIAHDNITLWGAGRNDDGEGTALYSRGAYSVVDGNVVRGHGIRIVGTSSPEEPRQNIMLRDVELNGQAGYTGNFGWPANPETGDGWDITHKGIVLAQDAHVDSVSVERVWVRSFRGEQIYAGGRGMGFAHFDDIISEDTNASTFNVHGNVLVENSRFGKSRFWMEIGGRWEGKDGIYRNNHFHDAAYDNGAIAFSQGDLPEQSHLFENNTIEQCGVEDNQSGYAFMFGQGVGGPITIRSNTFEDCAIFLSGSTPNADYSFAQNITIEQNTFEIRGGTPAMRFFTDVHDSIIQDNTISFQGEEGAVATYCCGSFEGVVVENNTFDGEEPPERVTSLDGPRPLFRGNEYSSAGLELPMGTESVEPTHEAVLLSPEADTAEVHLFTDWYADGQETTFSVSNDSVALFRKGNSTYEVGQDVYVTKEDQLRMRYDAGEQKWIEVE